ncbi:MAG TPA: RdgB/HAM1 family non-canonical purine NTP pyrophosphatase [Microbacteriaceae bacterium]|nr:RdgB/HAM1 family non-canonical purine NTP pyrophosphatase [Microbacteriaceae bacterium]
MKKVVLASHNPGKLEELKRILEGQIEGIELIGYDGPEPVENGTSFAENALLKARAAALHTGLPAVADDSGISVDILGGSPGIFSARWAGKARSDTANLNLLLEQLADIGKEHRQAAFICAAALVVPGINLAKDTSSAEVSKLGVWPGEILSEPRGTQGFGYDPIFKPKGFDRSAAELSSAEKDAHSHRRQAFLALIPELEGLAKA